MTKTTLRAAGCRRPRSGGRERGTGHGAAEPAPLGRKGVVYNQANAWTALHRLWLRGLRFEHASEADVSDDYLLAIEQLEERLRGLEEKLEGVAQKTPYAEPVGWLRCFRGIDTVTAMTIVTELYRFERFHSPRGLMAFLGLVPSEQTSGYDLKRGRITRMAMAMCAES